jgi:hypothetical protein
MGKLNNTDMKMAIRWLVIIFLFPTTMISQNLIRGKILNQETMLPVSNVHIREYDKKSGTVSDNDGIFTLETDIQNVSLYFTSVGYKHLNIKVIVKNDTTNIGYILMTPAPYSLDEITVSAGMGNTEQAPITVNTISSREIENTIGDRPFPLILNNTPGVFSVRNGGGSGDASLSIRGFHQENLSLLLNGIPINGEENGLVYWSNWLGLSNSATEIQIQKGAGMANASVYGIGGVVNIITRNPQELTSGSFSAGTTSYGNFNINAIVNTGKLKNNWSLTTMFNIENGPGYIDATNVKALSYFFTANKKLNDKHEINITLIGAPQEHGQRTIKQSNSEVDIHGLKYNKDWGGFNGDKRNASKNFYHKPFLTISDYFQIDDKNLLNTTIYASYGYGGGLWSESFNYSPSIFSYRDNSGQLDWYEIYAKNANNTDTYTLDDGTIVEGYSFNVQTKFLASHVQAGFVTDYEHKFNSKLTLKTGLHYRYFNSYVREVIDDLLGGKFFIEDYSWSLAGVAERNQIKTVGDIIKVDNNSIINFTNVWSQLVYSTSKTEVFLSASLNNNWYKRIDRYNYISNTKSETVSKMGFDLRYGAKYNFNEANSIYYNAAYISRAPYFKYVFGNFTNVVVTDLKNENAYGFEIGYKHSGRTITANLVTFYTKRKNVSMLSNEYVQLENNDQSRAMINGLNSINMGIEADINIKISNKFNLGGWLSIGDFRWDNNVSATLFNDNNVPTDTVNVFVKGLYIGGTAQNQAGSYFELLILKTINLRGEYQFNDRIFADFDPTQRDNPEDLSQSYMFPSYGVINLYMSIPFKLGNSYGKIQLNGYNVLDKKYIVTGEDGANHDLDSFRGFWSFGRTISIGLKLNF